MIYTLGVSQAHLEVWGILLGVLVVLVGGVAFTIRSLRTGQDGAQWERLLQRAEKRTGIRRDSSAHGPLVSYEFHTYSGFLVFFSQTRHAGQFPGPLVLEVLRQLHRYNLIHALMPYPGIVFVPLLSWASYSAQCRRIRREIQTAGSIEMER